MSILKEDLCPKQLLLLKKGKNYKNNTDGNETSGSVSLPPISGKPPVPDMQPLKKDSSGISSYKAKKPKRCEDEARFVVIDGDSGWELETALAAAVGLFPAVCCLPAPA